MAWRWELYVLYARNAFQDQYKYVKTVYATGWFGAALYTGHRRVPRPFGEGGPIPDK